MGDIANAIYRHLRTMAPHQLERLTAIQLKEAADEIARLRLTDAEREAINGAILEMDAIIQEFIPTPVETRLRRQVATLRCLLARTK
jgi:hypothetical protein